MPTHKPRAMRICQLPRVMSALIAMVAVLAAAALTRNAHAQGTATPSTVQAPATQPAAGQPAQAQPRSFLPKPSQGAVTAAAPPSGFFARMMAMQRDAHESMVRAVRSLKAGGGFSAALVLSGISFLYGVLHAAGPGHGKAVISSYALADGETVRRATLLSFMAAAVQALSALLLVGIIFLLMKATKIEMTRAELWLERLSWLFVAGIGLWLLVRQLRSVGWFNGNAAHAHGHDHGHHDHAHHGHHHDHGHAHHDHTAHGHSHDAKKDNHAHHNHKHGDDHHAAHGHAHAHGDDCETCGHAHMPTPEAVSKDWSLKRAIALAVSIGIRPCTGAIVVLVFAIGQGLMWAGVMATFAMALGTAITVSLLAAMAVWSRDFATKLGGGASSIWGTRIQVAAGFIGALLVFGLGTAAFLSTLGTQGPF